MTAVAADLTGDDWPDIYVASDSTASILYRNNRDGTFTDVAHRERHRVQRARAARRPAWAWPSATTTATACSTRQERTSPTTFRRSTATWARGSSRTPPSRRASTSRTATSSGARRSTDFDNDGFSDLLYVTGHVYPEIERLLEQYPHRGPRVLFRNLSARDSTTRRAQRARRSAATHSSRGAAFGDIDNDGDVDVARHEHERAAVAPAQRLRAAATRGSRSRSKGARRIVSAIGATVIVTAGGRRQARAVLSQSSYYSHDDAAAAFRAGESLEGGRDRSALAGGARAAVERNVRRASRRDDHRTMSSS